MRVAQGTLENNESAKKVFAILVKATLEYRDTLLAERGIAVTVDDVRTALTWLAPVLATGELPQTDRWISLDLLKAWLEELKG